MQRRLYIDEAHTALDIFRFAVFLRYTPDFLHVIITFIGFQITFSIMGSYNTPPFISEVVSNCPFTHAFSAESETLALTGLTLAGVFYFE